MLLHTHWLIDHPAPEKQKKAPHVFFNSHNDPFGWIVILTLPDLKYMPFKKSEPIRQKTKAGCAVKALLLLLNHSLQR